MNFATSVVGSFPRPPWLIQAFKDYNNKLINKKQLNKHVNTAVKLMVLAQEKLGLDIITDGEQGRTSFVNFVGDKIQGLKPTHITELNKNALNILKEHNTFLPYIRAVPHDYLPEDVKLVDDEYTRLKQYTKKQIKITLPSPYLLMWETWHNTITSPYYKTPEDLGEVYIKIIRNEIKRLQNMGLTNIQIDEPMLGNLIEATDTTPDRYRKIFGIINGQKYRGFKEELQLCKDMMVKVLKGINNIEKEVHICHWPNSTSPNYGNGVEQFIPEIFNMGFNNLVIENKADGSGNIEKLMKEYPEGMKISIGVLDVRNHIVETPESIVKHVEKITNYVDPSNIVLVPDCGFACGMLHKYPIPIMVKKLANMVEASTILRKKYQ